MKAISEDLPQWYLVIRKRAVICIRTQKQNKDQDRNENVYKDICNLITKEFRKKLYGNSLEAFENLKQNHEQD